MEQLIHDFSFGLFFWQLLLFVVLLFVLRKFAWKPILDAVNEREEGIKNAMDEAAKAREEMAALKAENDSILKEAKAERDAILKEAREIKEETINNAKEEAKQEAEKLITNAKAAIENEKLAAMTDIKNQIGLVSVEVAEKVLGKELSTENKQEGFIQDILGKINLS